MFVNGHRYALELYRADGTRLEQVPATVDWEPVREWLEFRLFCRSRQTLLDTGVVTTVSPQWHPTAGAPYVSGIGVTTSLRDGELLTSEIPTEFFRSLATEASRQLVERGLLRDGEHFRFLVTAYPSGDGETPPPSGEVVVEEIATPLPLRATPLSQLAGRAVTFAPVAAEEFPVYVPQQVLDEIADLVVAAGGVEVGGVLIGHLHRDTEWLEVFGEITAQIPAPHTRQSAQRMTFTAETWTAVRAAVDLRHQQELLLGWWHSHPSQYWTERQSPASNGDRSPLALNFYSADDLHLHRAIFPKAYGLGLVVTNAAAGLQFMLYGWNRGMIQSRGFHLIPQRARPTKPGKRSRAHGRQAYATELTP